MRILCAGMLSADVIVTPIDYSCLNEDTILTDRIEVKNGGDCVNVVVKLGEKGAYIRGDSLKLYQRSYPVKVKDTTGAGDSFVAGFLCKYTEGAPFGECARFASVIAAKCVASLGATDGIPTRDDAECLSRMFSHV